MAYLAPSEFVTKMVDAGESKIFMSTRDTVIRAYMAGAILALAAWFAVTINVNTGQPLVGALLFPVGFSMLYLLGFDLLTGVFVLAPLALIDKRPGVTLGWRLKKLGPCLCWQFRRRADGSLHDGVRDNIRLHAGSRQGRHGDRKRRRSSNARLRGTRSGRHGDIVSPRHAVQLDGLYRCRRRHDLNDRSQARSLRCGCRSWCSSTWCSSIPS